MKSISAILLPIILILPILPNSGLSAQSQIKSWEEGPLTINDIRSIKDTSGNMSFVWRYKKTREKISWNTYETRLSSNVYLGRDYISNKTEIVDTSTLKMAQLIFDVHELMAREGAEKFLQQENDDALNDIYEYYYHKATKIEEQIIAETNNKKDSLVIERLSELYHCTRDYTMNIPAMTKVYPAVYLRKFYNFLYN